MTKIWIDTVTAEEVLEALEYIHEGANNQGPHTGISWRCVSNKAEPAITALREALTSVPDWASEAIKQPAQPAREFVGLTDEEMYGYCPNWLSQEQCKVWIEQIEAKLKAKNSL